jgi:TRAP-type C4-dicarboxylate transport system permease small subunit
VENYVFKWLDKIEDIFAKIGMWILGLMVALVVFEVFTREVFNISFGWSIDFTSYALLYIGFLGAGWLLREGGHVSVTILEEYLHARALKTLDIFVILLGLIMSVVLTVYGVKVTLDLLINDVRSLTVLKTPLAYVVMAIPLGSFVLSMEFIRKGYLLVKQVSVAAIPSIKHENSVIEKFE